MKGLRNHLCNGKLMLTPLMLTAILFSCQKENLQEQSFEFGNADNQLAVVEATTTPSPNTIFQEAFEGDQAFATYVKKQTATTYGISQTTSPLFSGSKIGRFELRDTDPEASGGTRTEVLFPAQSNLNRWYSFAAYFPSENYKYDIEDETLCQWHQEGGTSGSISLRTEKDRMILSVIPTYKGTSQRIDLGPVVKDKWNTFIIHINHSSGSDGLIEFWINGQKIVNRSGANMYSLSTSGVTSPRWKLGIYKSNWNGTKTTYTKERILFVDNVKLSNENATYEEVASAYTTTTTPSTSPVSSFTLVSAHTEQDIMTITDGATISLSGIDVPKLNIRANSDASLGSVKLELTGAQSKTYIDSKVPYALHGDDGYGNYFYGNWFPPAVGTYTLKATPYSGASASGTAGTPKSISFTIVN